MQIKIGDTVEYNGHTCEVVGKLGLEEVQIELPRTEEFIWVYRDNLEEIS